MKQTCRNKKIVKKVSTPLKATHFMDFYKKLKFQHSNSVSTAILQINADKYLQFSPLGRLSSDIVSTLFIYQLISPANFHLALKFSGNCWLVNKALTISTGILFSCNMRL